MEYDEDNEDDEQEGFFTRLKESPRTVSVLIIILIVAAAIYAFSDDSTPVPPEDLAAVTGDSEMVDEPTQGGTGEEMEEDGAMMEDGDAMEEKVKAPEAVSPEALAEKAESLPETQVVEEGYIETAVKGDGLTHIARRSATRYLAETEISYEVTNEHRIYIEDYMKDRMIRQPLQPGTEIAISYPLLEEAVAAAGELSPAQLQNLTKYTHVLN